MTIGDLRAAYRWPWDETRGGKYAAQNDNDWIKWQGAWTHRTDLESRKAYWKRNGWK